jgi:predicted secreted protein
LKNRKVDVERAAQEILSEKTPVLSTEPKPEPESRKMLEFAHIWKLLELHFLNPENLISWPAKRVMRQVERQVANCQRNGTAQDKF